VAQLADVDLADVDAIDQQRAVIRLVQADQQFGQRALARAAAADDADLLAGRMTRLMFFSARFCWFG
jgi:hypothetical protein